MNSVRWNTDVTQDTDESVRMYLAGQGGGCERDLSKFIEEAVRAHILEFSAEAAKDANIDVHDTELSAIVEESLQWARSR